MVATFNNAQIQQIKLAVEQVIDAKFGENVMERINRIENNTDSACKISSDTQQEMAILGSRVDRHDHEINSLQHFVGFASTN